MSDIRVDTISAANGTDPVTLTKQSAAKVHANIQSSNTIRASLNVSSIVDQGTGRIQYSFTSAFNGIWYSWAGLNKDGGGYNDDAGVNSSDSDTQTASVFTVFTHHNGGANDSEGGVGLSIHGDLA